MIYLTNPKKDCAPLCKERMVFARSLAGFKLATKEVVGENLTQEELDRIVTKDFST